MPHEARQLEPLRASLERWAALWGVRSLPEKVILRTSARFRTSLGRYRPDRREVTLAAWLLDGPSELLDEVLCHEAAHAAVHEVHGRGARPHGREWRRLMEVAGFAARVRVPSSALPEGRRARALWRPIGRRSFAATFGRPPRGASR